MSIPKIRQCKGCDRSGAFEDYCPRCTEEVEWMRAGSPIKAYEESLAPITVFSLSLCILLVTLAFTVPV